ncbi:MAG: FAD-dependent oxidoreductase, partial [Enterococcus sp.]
EKNNIDVFIEHEVTSIDPINKTVSVKNLADGTNKIDNYDRLILASGARPTLPPIKGANEAKNGFILRNVT